MWCKLRVQLPSLCVVIQFFQHHLSKRLCFPHCVSLAFLSKAIWPYISGLTSGLSSVSLVYMSLFIPVTYCFGYHSFVICFTIRKCLRPWAFFFCLKIFWLFKVLWDGIWILGWFSISAKEKKKAFGILMGIAMIL